MTEKDRKPATPGNGQAPTDQDWELDLDALAPKPRGAVTIQKKRYAVWHYAHLKLADSIRVIELDTKCVAGGLPYPELIEAMREQLRLLAPSIPDTVMESLDPERLATILGRAKRTAEVPTEANPPGGGAGPGSTSSLPSSPTTTASPIET
jgi:hypothetical protein